MKHPDKPKLTESQFDEEFLVACKGLKHKYNWNLEGVSSMETDGIQMMVFDTSEIGVPVAFPFQQFASLVHDCFYEPDITLCDQLHYFLVRAREEVKKQQ